MSEYHKFVLTIVQLVTLPSADTEKKFKYPSRLSGAHLTFGKLFSHTFIDFPVPATQHPCVFHSLVMTEKLEPLTLFADCKQQHFHHGAQLTPCVDATTGTSDW